MLASVGDLRGEARSLTCVANVLASQGDLTEVLVHRPVSLLHASFRPHLAVKPFASLPFTSIGLGRDLHPQAVERARRTHKKAYQPGRP